MDQNIIGINAMIDSLEHQLRALRLMISGIQPSAGFKTVQAPQPKAEELYTSDEEDEAIEEAMKVDAKREEFLNDIFEQAKGQRELLDERD